MGKLLTSELFDNIKNKKIMVYGTGKISRQLLPEMADFRIEMVSDRCVFSDAFEGLPFIDFDFVEREDIDAIIIASSIKNQKEIYLRIADKALRNGWEIYNYQGVSLISYYGVEQRTVSSSRYFRKSYKELAGLIEKYDNISFDLFDTLVMRKVLVPTDILDIVYQKLNAKGIRIEEYKRLRIKAEIEAQGASIYKIYEILQQENGWSNELRDTILKAELDTERENIIPRYSMVELMNYAISIGKKVCIISDMYLPQSILASFLDNLGVTGYEKLYVSCEYNGTGKRNGLFNIYLNDCKPKSECLHIGDNIQADIDAAIQEGIDAYEIKSAYDILKISNLHMLIGICKTKNDKNYVGLLISKIFNNPFALYQTSGVVQISDWATFGHVMIAPLIICMLDKILKEIDVHKNVDGILFTARDCFMVKEVYDRLSFNMLSNISLPYSFYLYGSRRINLKVLSAIDNSADLLQRYVISDDPERVLSDYLGMTNPDEIRMGQDEDTYSYFKRLESAIKMRTIECAKNYGKYLNQIGLDRDNKYIICDSVAQGTTQYCLQQMGYCNICGVYLAKYHGNHDYNIPVYPVFDTPNDCECSIYYKDAILETIFTSMEASVIDIDKDCNFIFSNENRKCEEKEIIQKIQYGSVEFAVEFLNSLYFKDTNMSADIAEFCFRMMDDFEYTEQCKVIENMASTDDGIVTKWVNVT